MASQKIENLLNLALDATQEEREKSLELEVGYDPVEREWELIVKYSGTLEQVRKLASSVVELQNEYAIITVLESKIEALTQIPEIEYIEKPKRLFPGCKWETGILYQCGTGYPFFSVWTKRFDWYY